MLDLFTIFSKGGIVLWCFQGTSQIFTPSVNALIKSVILQERTGSNIFQHESLTLMYKLDNEYELIFVVAYQKILQLSYIDKFLNDIHLEFRDKYKEDLQQGRYFQNFSFNDTFKMVLRAAEDWGRAQAQLPKQMRTYVGSYKSKKTVASMIERKGEEKENKKPGKGKKKSGDGNIVINKKIQDTTKENSPPKLKPAMNGDLDEETIKQNRLKLAQRMCGGNKKTVKTVSSPPKPKKGKEGRQWSLSGTPKDIPSLDFSQKDSQTNNVPNSDYMTGASMVGQMVGKIEDLVVESDSEVEEECEEEEEEQYVPDGTTEKKPQAKGRSMFSMFRSLVGSKSLTMDDMKSALEKLRDHLIAKNVAADISKKLCNSVSAKLEGKVLGTFESVHSTVKTTLTEALVQLLSPKQRIDILRDIIEAQQQKRIYAMTFCGVNGVGKSTNLAKICFWLIENGFRVLIAACDTFRAGAVEQLRTHTRRLNFLHPAEKHGGVQMVQLYEKGYGKDAAGIAMEAINFARDMHIDVVLIDTAGRMQDNEPLMRSLAKIIRLNEPDLVLFVGEALVGNEAVDQLVKFNQALADHSSVSNPHLIDGIVLTKFDTIDDKVGAAISMTYITGQPIVFVGTGQDYCDLKTLNAKAVVHALMK